MAKKPVHSVPAGWFEEFWGWYPRKVSRAQAKVVYDKLAGQSGFVFYEKALKGVKAYAMSEHLRTLLDEARRKGESPKIPYAQRWLNEHRYMDEHEPSVAVKGTLPADGGGMYPWREHRIGTLAKFVMTKSYPKSAVALTQKQKDDRWRRCLGLAMMTLSRIHERPSSDKETRPHDWTPSDKLVKEAMRQGEILARRHSRAKTSSEPQAALNRATLQARGDSGGGLREARPLHVDQEQDHRGVGENPWRKDP